MPNLLFRNVIASPAVRAASNAEYLRGPIVQDFDEPKVARDRSGKCDAWKVRLYLDDGSTRDLTGQSKRGHGEHDAEEKANALWGHAFIEGEDNHELNL